VVARGGLVIAPNDNELEREGFSPNGVWYDDSDLEYADHIAACAVRDHNIDPRQIYVTGCSAGGIMASAMAVKRSSYVAAAAPNSGGLVTTFGVALQDPTRVPAVLTMHGGADDTVTVNFGETSGRLDDFIVGAGGFAVDCDHGSGHCGAPGELQVVAWDFMNAHPFGTAPSPYAGGLAGDFPAYCAVW
jgi:predicted esterase